MTAEGLVGHEGDRPAGQPANVQASAAVGRGVAHDDFRAAGNVVGACGDEGQGAGLDRRDTRVSVCFREGHRPRASLVQAAVAQNAIELDAARSRHGAGCAAEIGVRTKGQLAVVCGIAEGDIAAERDRIENCPGGCAVRGKRAAIESQRPRTQRAARDGAD